MPGPKTGDAAEDDLHAQIAKLRAQLDALVARGGPAVAEAVRHAGDAARGQVDALSDQVRAQPITAVLIAAAAGYLFGRLSR